MDDSDSDTGAGPPISMLINAANSGPSASDVDSDANSESDADSGSVLELDAELESDDTSGAYDDAGTNNNVDPESTTTVSSPGIAVASMNAEGLSSILAAKISTLVLSSSVSLERGIVTLDNNINIPTSATTGIQSTAFTSAPTAGVNVNGSFTGGGVRSGRGLGGEMRGGWLVCGVEFLVWFGLCCCG